MAAQDTASIAAPQICTTRAGDADLLGSRSRKRCNSFEAALVPIPWNEPEMWEPVLDGCGAKWLSRQLSAQGEKAARRQTVMGIRRQDALDGKRARATIRQFSTELC